MVAGGLCGHSDWRLPTAQELNTLADFSHYHSEGVPGIDTNYFPNTQFDAGYWSRVSDAKDPGRAWYVYFNGGYMVANYKDYEGHIMVVRKGK